MKMRALMSYHEIKHCRMKRIKSKRLFEVFKREYVWYRYVSIRFHRIQRKRQQLAAARNSEPSPKVIEKAKKLRAKVHACTYTLVMYMYMYIFCTHVYCTYTVCRFRH